MTGGRHGLFFKDNSKGYTENFSSERLKSVTVRVCITDYEGDFYITDILLQGGPVAMGWVGHPSEIRWTLDG